MFEILMAIGFLVLSATLFFFVLFLRYGKDWNR